MTRLRNGILGSALMLGALALASACEDDPAPDEAADGVAACQEIGELCHETEPDPFGSECHDVGHSGDPGPCLERYDECITYCTDYIENHAGGAGGGGGAPHGHGGAGGESHGGATAGGATSGGGAGGA